MDCMKHVIDYKQDGRPLLCSLYAHVDQVTPCIADKLIAKYDDGTLERGKVNSMEAEYKVSWSIEISNIHF